MLKTIKFQKKQPKRIKLNNSWYTPYLIGNLPKKFAFIYDADKEQDGYFEWFNYKGLTYIQTPIND